MNYTLADKGVVLNNTTFIPEDSGNRMWRDFQNWLQEGNTPAPQPTISVELDLVSIIQNKLDDFARERGYDNIVSLCSYATSKHPKFGPEGLIGVDARDLLWGTSLQIKEDVINGLRPVPTIDEVLHELPTLVWPD